MFTGEHGFIHEDDYEYDYPNSPINKFSYIACCVGIALLFITLFNV